MDETTIPHWVDGARWTGASDRTGEVTNPATGLVTGRVAMADEADAARVIACRERRRGGLGGDLADPAYPGDLRVPRTAGGSP